MGLILREWRRSESDMCSPSVGSETVLIVNPLTRLLKLYRRDSDERNPSGRIFQSGMDHRHILEPKVLPRVVGDGLVSPSNTDLYLPHMFVTPYTTCGGKEDPRTLKPYKSRWVLVRGYFSSGSETTRRDYLLQNARNSVKS